MKVTPWNKGKKGVMPRVWNKGLKGKDYLKHYPNGIKTPDNTGRKYSQETIEKMSNSNKGKKRSQETRDKLSKMMKERYENGLVPWAKGLNKNNEKIKRIADLRKNGKEIKCYYCQNLIYKSKCRLKDTNSFFCNRNCHVSYQKRNMIKKVCENCGNIYITSRWKARFCSMRCRDILWSGPKHPHYIHGMSTKGYPKYFNAKFKFMILERDKFKCIYCNLSSKEHKDKFKQQLHIHHIDYNKDNTTPNNCCALCLSCNVKANFNKKAWRNFCFDYTNKKILEVKNAS